MDIQELIDFKYEEIEGLKLNLSEDHYMNPEQEDELEELIAQAIKFGELCAKRDAKAQAVPEWISVEDKLPPVDETVLVCWDYAPDIEPEKEYTTIDENLDEYWPNCQDEPPTHWMPLPKVIKAQEQSHESK